MSVIRFGAYQSGKSVVRKFQYGVRMYFDVGERSMDEYLYSFSGDRSGLAIFACPTSPPTTTSQGRLMKSDLCAQCCGGVVNCFVNKWRGRMNLGTEIYLLDSAEVRLLGR